MYAYQLPSVDWSILIFLPFTVTVGSPCASSCDDMEESETTTSTTIGPVTILFENVFSADTNKFALCAAFAFGIMPGNANTSPPANIIVISVRLVSFLTISFFMLLTFLLKNEYIRLMDVLFTFSLYCMQFLFRKQTL